VIEMPGVIEVTARPDKVLTGKAAAEAAKPAAHMAAAVPAAHMAAAEPAAMAAAEPAAMATTTATTATTSLCVGCKHAADKQGDYQNHRKPI
jgi:hypothetical protein